MQDKITYFTGISADEQSQMIYEAGLMYLQFATKSSLPYLYGEEVADEISRSKTFWNWWKMHWNYRNMAFVEDMQLAEDRQRNVSAALAVQIYRQLHDPLQLIGGLNMNGIVLEDSYARMIGEINDYATKKVQL